MAIIVKCSCRQRFSAGDGLAGKQIACPSCGKPLAIPAANVATQAGGSSKTATSSNRTAHSPSDVAAKNETLGALGLADTSQGRERRLNAIVAEYLEAAENGRTPDQSEVVRRYPEFQAELIDFFASQKEVSRVAGTLRRAAAPSVSNRGGNRFGNFELLAEIGRGGMGVVYKAKQLNLGRVVALKMILAGRLASETDIQRFQTEAEIVAKLDHPHIVPILEFGQEDGHPYFTMKLIDGPSLDRELLRFAQDPRRAACLVATLAGAVEYAHGKGLLHRDLKPSNIVLDASGKPYITDFGLAKRIEEDSLLTRTGDMIGTPGYMAPEQAANPRGTQTRAVDIYGLGAILYACLTGRPPFQGETPLKTQERLLQTEPIPPRTYNSRLDAALETICLKCLKKHPSGRYASARELADDLQRWLAGKPIRARLRKAFPRFPKLVGRRPAIVASIGSVACLAIVLSILGAWDSGRVGSATQVAGARATTAGSNSAENGANDLRLPHDFAFNKFTTVRDKTPISELIQGDYQMMERENPHQMILLQGRDKITGLYGNGLQVPDKPNKVDGISFSATFFFVPQPFACYRDDKLLGIWDPQKRELRAAAPDEAEPVFKAPGNQQSTPPMTSQPPAKPSTASPQKQPEAANIQVLNWSTARNLPESDLGGSVSLTDEAKSQGYEFVTVDVRVPSDIIDPDPERDAEWKRKGAWTYLMKLEQFKLHAPGGSTRTAIASHYKFKGYIASDLQGGDSQKPAYMDISVAFTVERQLAERGTLKFQYKNNPLVDLADRTK
jgi:serine/threonine protein kinase